ncbi:hypothetical protein [uncultured Sanguibacteroides sp.]|uniref:hypothetical protein n=1 Tax=uncultured Sanguibacteroides sp. TaxID=1635151 RepID=UPI0025F45D54|nr:hypothetical protein [uncultured Sanguibacteroides sp.]
MNLRVVISGLDVALPLDVELVLKFQNSLLEDKNDDVTYPFTIPLKVNRNIFGDIDRIVQNSFNPEFPSVVLFGPYELLRGFATITDITSKEVELYISTAKMSFWRKATNIMVRDCNIGSEDFANETEAVMAMNRSLQGEKNYVTCPLFDENFTETTLLPPAEALFQKVFNPYNINTKQFSFVLDGKTCVYLPFMRLKFVIEELIKWFGYRVGKNCLNYIEGFQDILIVNRSGMNPKPRLFNFRHCLPYISVKDFFADIEKKFNLVFWVDVNRKEISIENFNSILTGEPFSILVEDGVDKKFDDDNKTGYRFKDKDISDSTLDSIKSSLEWEVGEGDFKQIDCISTPVNTIHDGINRGANQNNIAIINYSNVNVYPLFDKSVVSEFRLAVYRGYYKRNGLPASTEPYMSPEPEWDESTPINLTWVRGLSTLHRDKVNFLVKSRILHEIKVQRKIEYIRSVKDLLCRAVVISGQKYVTKEVEIKLGKDNVVEFVYRGYPL